MEDITIEEILELQEKYGIKEIQDNINSGTAWQLEGSYGRQAMICLEDGACMLPEEDHHDYWGNLIPNRNTLKEGAVGTLFNYQRFWHKVRAGEIDLPLPGDELDI